MEHGANPWRPTSLRSLRSGERRLARRSAQRVGGLVQARIVSFGLAGHFADVAQQRQQQFRNMPGTLPHESASLSVGPILREEGQIEK